MTSVEAQVFISDNAYYILVILTNALDRSIDVMFQTHFHIHSIRNRQNNLISSEHGMASK